MGVPLVVVDAGDARARDAARAARYWEAKGIPVQLAVLDAPLPRAERDRVLADANAVINSRVARPAPRRPRPRFTPLRPAPPTRSRAARLRWDNGYGGFSEDGSEYVVRVGAAGNRPPMPWINVVANEQVGFLASEAGAGYTWSRNSREHRLTPWSNDPVLDPHGEALWIRDEETKRFWSPLPGPTSAGVPCEVRHGFGYTSWRQACADLEQEVVAFVSRHDPVRVVRVRLRNVGRRRRRLSLFSYARLVLGVAPEESTRSVVTARDPGSQALLAWNALAGDFAGGVAFTAAVVPPRAKRVRVTADRTAFVGRHGSLASPAAVAASTALDGRTGAGLDPCAALQVPVAVRPGETVEVSFLLGEVGSRADARALVARYRCPDAIADALSEVRRFWRETVSAVTVETPVPGIDVMLNGWLLYQDLACRMWGRSAFYQSGGAFGFRDQLQDSTALVWSRPELTRAQIVLHAAHQFVEGDVLHWWHPPSGRGTRTRFSDDLVWLAWAASFYVRTTGDWSVLDEPAPFVRARPLAPGEDEAYLLPEPAEETGDVYAHCCRALDRALTRGAHGLPLMGTGDWNDGMNRVGREGRGESVWMAFFLYAVLGDFVPLCERRGDTARAARYAEYRRDVRAAAEATAWDGAWYRRAYYDDGTPLGSAAGDECRIDALVQAWAVISGAAPRERAEQAMDAVERDLVDESAGLVRLLWPPFDRTPHDPGYIKGYVPGIRENGGQYTHAALWVVRALAELGRRDRAAALLERIGPVWHGMTRDRVAVSQVEPYVVVADIYGVPPHVGRGGWTWYTGSAGWMYRVALESVLGVAIEAGQTLCVQPRIPDRWPRASVALRLADGVTRYEVELANPTGRAERVVRALVDGVAVQIVDGAARVPLARDGQVHRVRVELG
jgi:cyclic beta-1,2-glucan synthetase